MNHRMDCAASSRPSCPRRRRRSSPRLRGLAQAEAGPTERSDEAKALKRHNGHGRQTLSRRSGSVDRQGERPGAYAIQRSADAAAQHPSPRGAIRNRRGCLKAEQATTRPNPETRHLLTPRSQVRACPAHSWTTCKSSSSADPDEVSRSAEQAGGQQEGQHGTADHH